MAQRYPWSVLDIPPTVDERAIQKAYAAKLRVTRPDEDPQGFQELREARDHAMAERHHHVAEANDPVATAPSPDPAPEHTVILESRPDAPVSSEPGSVAPTLPLPPETDDPSSDSSDVAKLLERVGTPHPWRDLKAQWAKVFDAMEQAPLANHPYDMWAVLHRLIGDIRMRVGQIPDITDWQGDPQAGDRGPLGPYVDILRDFDGRFGILKQDSVLLDYMDEEDARDFTTALAIANGREALSQPRVLQAINVEAVEERHVQAVWAGDPKMFDYYHKAIERDDFPWSFNLLALLFPLPVALYYRLNGAAALCAGLVVVNASFAVMQKRGMDMSLAALASTFYMIVAFAIAFNWRRMRINALSSQIQKLTDANLATAEFGKGLIAWSRPNIKGMLLGVLLLIIAVSARILAR